MSDQQLADHWRETGGDCNGCGAILLHHVGESLHGLNASVAGNCERQSERGRK